MPAAGLAAVSLFAFWCAKRAFLLRGPFFVEEAPALRGGRRPHAVALRAEAEPLEAEVVESSALVDLQRDIEADIASAQEAKDTDRITRLARLMVLAKAGEGAAAWQATEGLRKTIDESIAATLRDFVGKDDYDLADVAAEVDRRVSEAVKALDNVYLTPEAAASAPPGSNPVILSDVMAPVVDQVKVGAKEAVLAFTGKEEYEFGDITKEAARRAGKAIATVLGKEEYEFGDISRTAAGKVKDAVKDLTGKEEYQFGDITKAVLRNTLNFLEGGEKR